jgi:hypothetical protein
VLNLTWHHDYCNIIKKKHSSVSRILQYMHLNLRENSARTPPSPDAPSLSRRQIRPQKCYSTRTVRLCVDNARVCGPADGKEAQPASSEIGMIVREKRFATVINAMLFRATRDILLLFLMPSTPSGPEIRYVTFCSLCRPAQEIRVP